MSNTFQFSLVSPERVILEQPVTMVVLPGSEGNIGVLPDHAPMVTTLRPGVLTVYEGDKILTKMFVDGGVSEITPTRCTALVTKGTPLDALDRSSLELKIKNLIEDLEESETPEERKEASLSLDITRAKLMEILVSQGK